ncbi:MAG TPA: chromosome segregation protein SMC [bacterium]
MRFKKLEIFGFKSFCNKTTVHFEPGVTAIVGPNGSGKSNIVDSIRWVLGEHNPRDVRAPRLEDVIFNGTDTKAPLSVAEVHLTISNEAGLLPIAFSEVTITRRVFRSGETECFINQAPCRLRDIRELFMGTGLGGGTYAIIEQGHIDMVLSSKPEERRVVFEEASGIAKYLTKKQETIRRLDEVEEHLVRIADITGEVRRQVSALERQANKARQYQTQWERLKSLELRLTVDELRQGRSRSGELERRLQQLTATQETLESRKQEHVRSLEACNAAVSAVQQRLQDARTQIVECASQIEQHESQFELKGRWIEELKAQLVQLEQDELQLSGRVEQLSAQLERLSGAEAEIHAQRSGIEPQLAQHDADLAGLDAALREAESALGGIKTDLFAAASEATHQRNEFTDAASRLRSVEGQLGRLEGQRSQQAAGIEDVRARLAAAREEHSAVRTQHEALERRSAEAQQGLDAAGARRHELQGRLHQLRDQLAGERTHARLLEELWRRYDGFSDTVRALMQEPVEGLFGPLADLVQAAPGYEDVVEAALGPLADALVVRDREVMMRCREQLSARTLEGARFLVLSDCPAEAPAGAEARQADARASVRELVRVDPLYRPLVDWLLNDSWMVEDLHPLLADAGRLPDSRLVSLRGERWDRRSWRLTGQHAPQGAPDDDVSGRRVGRRQRWEQGAARVQALEQDVRALDQQAREAEQAWQAAVTAQESLKGELAHLAPSLHKIDAHALRLEHELARIDEEQRGRDLEIQELAAEQGGLRHALASAEQAVREAEARHGRIQQALQEAQTARDSHGRRREQVLVARAQTDAALRALIDRADAAGASRREAEAERTSLAQQLETKRAQRRDASARCEELAGQRDAHQAGREQHIERRAALETDASGIAEALQQEESARDQVLPRVLEVEQQLASLARETQECLQQRSERGYRRSHLIERLRELYQIDEAAIEAELAVEGEPIPEEQRAPMAEEVLQLRKKLEGLGPVSLGSVEEYDELKRRHEFLQSQQQDLIQARDDLKASIAQINKTARTQFKETFERIKQEFQGYFARLFNGGQADLALMDEGDVLESGIDIVARPPGKRLQNISLLSGGERALTAIALLFALFKVRPSPFCILDEIDAPLDEANVDRFTRVLEEFLELSQFILITHNKKTITNADSLYGVTMAEPGISRVLSAKFANGKPAQQPVSAASPA